YIYNESINIYSYLIPAVFFLLGEYIYSRVTSADFITFSIFIFTTVTYLSLSATYYTLINYS
ncbi:uncharacterized protein A1O9_10597, partial [Exophiala aquamarina CBS 119918]